MKEISQQIFKNTYMRVDSLQYCKESNKIALKFFDKYNNNFVWLVNLDTLNNKVFIDEVDKNINDDFGTKRLNYGYDD